MEEQKIVLNGQTYILELSQGKKPAKRFNRIIEVKLIKLFSKKFIYQEEGVSEDSVVNQEVTVIDQANVMMVSGKTEEAKRFLAKFVSLESEEKKVPDLNFEIEKGIATSKYSQDYLSEILNILGVTNKKGIRITLRR
jgi:hypothetical protein